MTRVPVVSADNTPLMPTKPSRARRWIKEGKAIGKFNKLGMFYVQLIAEPSDTQTQEIVIGLDPGKLYSGIAVQSKKYTLQMLHLVLPLLTVKGRMEQRAMMRRGRRGRRINRKVSFAQRAHRQARFDNRRGSQLPPSIRANRDLEYRTITLLYEIYPVQTIVVEEVKGDYVKATQGNKTYRGWVSGDTEKQISVSAQNWKRLGQFSKNKVRLIRRSIGLISTATKVAELFPSLSLKPLSFPLTEFSYE